MTVKLVVAHIPSNYWENLVMAIQPYWALVSVFRHNHKSYYEALERGMGEDSQDA